MTARRTTLLLVSIAILLAGGARAESWRSYHNEGFVPAKVRIAT